MVFEFELEVCEVEVKVCECFLVSEGECLGDCLNDMRTLCEEMLSFSL